MAETIFKEKEEVTKLLAHADIILNGTRPWDIQVHDDHFYSQILYYQNLGLGESYMDGLWDCESIDQMIARLINANIPKYVKTNKRLIFKYLMHKIFNYQTKRLAKVVARKHYDLGNKLFQAMLDKEMIYSCGYWDNATTLDQAQLNKMDLICKKLKLTPGMKLLDIGCGWGGLAKFAAKNYGVEVVGITISKEQKKLAEERCQGLPVKIMLQDYRDLTGEYDRIVSVGMFEHVGYKNYRTYMTVASRCLKEEGIFLLHTIGSRKTSYDGDPWMNKYIFPYGMLPSISQIHSAIDDLFVMEDWHNFGADYDKTLMAWHHNFNMHCPELKHEYDERFHRMWNYFLLSCAGAFRSRKMQLWQIIFSRGIPGGYKFRY